MIQPDPYVCSECGEPYVVPTLARLCEAKHAKEATDNAASR